MQQKNKILNPLTNRYVLRTGKIGLALLKSRKSRGGTGTICTRTGMLQVIGTCWFNSIFNTFVLSQRLSAYIIQKNKNIPSGYRSFDTCPLALKKEYFLEYFFKYHDMIQSKILEHNSSWRNGQPLSTLVRERHVYKQHPEVTESNTHAVEMIDHLQLLPPGWQERDEGYYPQVAVKEILKTIFGTNTYTISSSNLTIPIVKNIQNDLNCNFFFQIAEEGFGFPVSLANKILAQLGSSFVLDNAVIALSNTNDGMDHAIAAYVCEKEYFIFDSTNSDIIKLDWRIQANIERKFNATATFAYICYARI
jgi:hypothetical protein